MDIFHESSGLGCTTTTPMTTTFTRRFPQQQHHRTAVGGADDEEMQQRHVEHVAATIITRAVRRVAWRRLFQRLKLAVKAAETAYAVDFIRTLCPAEAELLLDPTLSPTIRFRFGGDQYPPQIFFKIYLSPCGTKVQYMSARQLFRASTQAAEDARSMMGPRKYMEQVIEDWYLHVNSGGMSDLIDVSDEREYVQVMTALDKQSAMSGGRSNDWRPLHTIEPTTSSSTVNDFIEHVRSGGRTELKMITQELNATVLIDDQLAKLRAATAHRALTRTRTGTQTGRMSAHGRARRMNQLRRAYGVGTPQTQQTPQLAASLSSTMTGKPATPALQQQPSALQQQPSQQQVVARSALASAQEQRAGTGSERRWSHSRPANEESALTMVEAPHSTWRDDSGGDGAGDGAGVARRRGDVGGGDEDVFDASGGFGSVDGYDDYYEEDDDEDKLFEWSQQVPVDVGALDLDEDLLGSL
ncbi:hypothetical protein PTSG_01217 [Salpingoeca rosetta]|uniref:Uncharacterized protein n=1 Tax=Salpingoeca rosetta (strain ATCC 50818 / BSB-021) TaxID=946362 RepID=F2U155_SALR5|nr:uncharacterized protein PTSG_01217 [Salpingoeca rosetta]EGD80629.1 hypothetical protein PTSG_01217 [Salpingoeca rosetta]|eukprot:XP_004997190.1 hypothetical protein PTSG_01217 [Salpingoeca rosetta]